MKEIKKNPVYRYLLILTIASAAGLQGWRTLFNNFAVETVSLNGFHIGIIQSVREIPGFLTLSAVILLIFIKEHKLLSLSVLFMGAGIMLTGFLPSFYGLIFTTLLMSFGFHYYESTNQSLILQYFDEYQSPLVMGSQRSMMSLVCIMVGAAIFFFSFILSYKIMFLIIGAMVFSSGIWGFFNKPFYKENLIQHRKLIFKRKYSLFYILTMLSGARRQIFMVFSVFLLVKKFGFTIQQVTVLFLVNNVINYFVAPVFAKAIKRFGERPVLFFEYMSLIVIFSAYAYCPYKNVVALLYILDHVTFNGSMAIRTYFQKIADKSDISSSTAVSFTVNHIAAVILPVIGGYLWTINYKIPFIAGTILAALSLSAACFIKTK
ncbi:MAG: MFS transporter [Candidatus Omnitrophota bacterium]